MTTELLAGKARGARDYLQEAGLRDVVDLRVGDAMELHTSALMGALECPPTP